MPYDVPYDAGSATTAPWCGRSQMASRLRCFSSLCAAAPPRFIVASILNLMSGRQ